MKDDELSEIDEMDQQSGPFIESGSAKVVFSVVTDYFVVTGHGRMVTMS